MVNIAVEENEGQLVLTLSGFINEKSSFDAIVPSDAKSVLFVLSDLKAINSVGLGTWVRFSRELSEKKVHLSFRACPTVFIDQIAMLPTFIPYDSEVQSFYAPYLCDNCEHEDEVLIEEDQLKLGTEDPFPKKTCPKCGSDFLLDELAEEHIVFAERQHKAKTGEVA